MKQAPVLSKHIFIIPLIGVFLIQVGLYLCPENVPVLSKHLS